MRAHNFRHLPVTLAGEIVGMLTDRDIKLVLGPEFVIGWEHERTVQYEGIAAIPTEAELSDAQTYYFDHFRDGPTRQTWPDLVYWRVRPTWIRYSNLSVNPPIIQEWDVTAIAGWLK
jgi:hypothetical protein